MKKSILILVIFIFGSISSICSQTTSKKDDSFTYKDFPQEKIFIHFNNTLLVSGENLFYKIYCINTSTNSLSNISKIAYIELISADKQTVLKHKIILKSGLGIGDFFIKTSIPSGNYKLVAYTQWMRNKGENAFFQNDITIINPFKANEKLSAKIPEDQNTIIGANDSVKENETIKTLYTPIKNRFIGLQPNKRTFLKREEVVLTIKSLKDNISWGNYSISVKKIDQINAPYKYNSSSFSNKKHLNTSPTDSILFLPELRGELLSGIVFIKDTNTPISNIKIGLSIPGENYIFKIATTNKSGIFYFNLDNEYKNSNAIVQVMHSRRDEYKIELDNYKLPNYNSFVFNDFKLTPKLKDYILQKSISNQIENAYHSIKKDSIEPINFTTPIFKSKEKKYFLNDYTRFKTLKETITEVVDAVYILQKKGEYTFHIKFYNDIIISDLLPLILIDGILIQDHNVLINYNAKNIKSIGVVNNKYIYGGRSFKGIISIETLKGDYNHSFKGGYIKSFELDKPQANKKYFKQVYEGDLNLNRIPDFRNQLLWHPNLTLNTNETQISFYTSDVTGDFEICIEGFTDSGKPVSVKQFISVKNK